MESNVVIDSVTGHLATCKFRGHVNRAYNGIKPHCNHVLKCSTRDNIVYCGGNCSNQACIDNDGMGRCVGRNDHWGKECKENGWDKNLSKCANIICDNLAISLDERKGINQHTISDLLGVPADRKFNHVSVKRREKYTVRRQVRFEEVSVSTSVSTSYTRVQPKTDFNRICEKRKRAAVAVKKMKSRATKKPKHLKRQKISVHDYSDNLQGYDSDGGFVVPNNFVEYRK